MDLSKLPRLSETDKHIPPPAPHETAIAPTPACASPLPPPAAAGLGAQIWLSGIIGLVLMMFGWRFARFVVAKLTGQPFHTNVEWKYGERAGQEVAYFDLQGFAALSEAGIFLFGLALVLEAIVLATVRRNTAASRALVGSAMAFTASVTVLNLFVALKLMSAGILPLMSGLALAYGGYIAIYEWQVLRQMIADARASA